MHYGAKFLFGNGRTHSKVRNYFYNKKDGQKNKQAGRGIYCELPYLTAPKIESNKELAVDMALAAAW